MISHYHKRTLRLVNNSHSGRAVNNSLVLGRHGDAGGQGTLETSEQGIVGIVCVQQALFNINVCHVMQCDIVPRDEQIGMIDSAGMWLYSGTVIV